MKYFLCLVGLFVGYAVHAQLQGAILNPKYEKMLLGLLHHTIPQISCDELFKIKDSVIILDTREWNEYAISHIPGAIYVGYKMFTIESIKSIPKEKTIVSYCSVGYRSEKISVLLKEAGFCNIFNLYGSIFEWVNRKYPVVNNKNNVVNEVHAYNYIWGRWVDGSNIKKKYF
jgi:rhodanese-related sulfurtransferase